MLDDRAPHRHLGAGFPRAHDVLKLLHIMGHQGVFVTSVVNESPESAARAVPEKFEYRAMAQQSAEIARYIVANARNFDVLWVSRPNNMAMLRRHLPASHPVWTTFGLVVYDAEAIFALREALQKKIYPQTRLGMSLEQELDTAQVADVVAVVNDAEGRYFSERDKKTVVLGSCYRVVPDPPTFGQTRGFLFVGAMHGMGSPNVDAIAWFCHLVAPVLREKLGEAFQLNVVGPMAGVKLAAPTGDDIKFLNMVPDLSGLYASHRVFIAPHRYAAGIPAKVLESSTHGLPVVASSLLVGQLGWHHGQEIFSAQTGDVEAFARECLTAYSDASAWQQVQSGAMQRIQDDHSEKVFSAAIEEILSSGRQE